MKLRAGLVAIAILVLISTFGISEYVEYGKRLDTLGWDACAPFAWLTVHAAENPGIAYDINGYNKGENTIYLFLPCRADISEIVYYTRDTYGNYIERVVDDFSQGNVLRDGITIIPMQSKLPTLYMQIDTEQSPYTINEVDEDSTKEKYCYGDIRLDVTDEMAAQNGWAVSALSREGDNDSAATVRIKGRGNSSMYLKRSYSIKLEKRMNLLSMGDSKKWALVPNTQDPSLMKNIVCFSLAEDAGLDYTPQVQPVDVFRNGVYHGTYLLSTKIEVSKNRIGIGADDYLANLYDPGTIQKMEFTSKYTSYSPHEDSIYAELVYPENALAEIPKAQEIWQEILNRIEDESSDAYLEDIDLESFVKYYWIQELSTNKDCWGRSAYSYYDSSEQKLYMGPIWDMDISFGNPEDKRFEWFARTRSWYQTLFQHQSFQEAATDMYFQGGGMRELFYATSDSLDELYEQLKISGQMDCIRWNDEQDRKIHVAYHAESYEEYAQMFIDYYRERLDWIDEQMLMERY